MRVHFLLLMDSVEMVKHKKETRRFTLAGDDKNASGGTVGQRTESTSSGDKPQKQRQQQQQHLDLETETMVLSSRCGASHTLDDKLREARHQVPEETILQTCPTVEEKLSSCAAKPNDTCVDKSFARDKDDMGPKDEDSVSEHYGGNTNQESPVPSAIPFAPSKSVQESPRPRNLTVSTFRTPRVEAAEGLRETDVTCSNSSSESSSGSSLSSDTSYDSFDTNNGGVLGDFAAGFDSWFDDVQGAGRQEFFGLFKRDVTPQFSRPALSLLGRNVSSHLSNVYGGCLLHTCLLC